MTVVFLEVMMEFFKQIGGLPFIISTSLAVFSFIAYTIREMRIKKWEKRQEEKHLLLSQNFIKNENRLSQEINSMLNITHGSNEMRVSGYKGLWSIMLKIRNNFPPCVSRAYSIYTKDEFNNLLRTDNQQYRNKSPVDAFIITLDILSKEAEEFRLMMNINAWNIYWVYQFFFGRLATLYSMSIEAGALIHFLDDNSTRNVLEKMIETETLSKLKTPEIFAFQNIYTFFEIKFIEQFSNMLSGFSLTKEIIDNALEINRLVRDTSNG
jgi:hypothetical protein